MWIIEVTYLLNHLLSYLFTLVLAVYKGQLRPLNNEHAQTAAQTSQRLQT